MEKLVVYETVEGSSVLDAVRHEINAEYLVHFLSRCAAFATDIRRRIRCTVEFADEAVNIVLVPSSFADESIEIPFGEHPYPPIDEFETLKRGILLTEAVSKP